MKKIVHHIGLDVHKEWLRWAMPKEPIYSLRFRRRSEASAFIPFRRDAMARQAPGGAGK